MIEINLLPENMRRVEGTPVARRFTIFGGVAALGVLTALNLVFFFNKMESAKKELARETTMADAAKKQADEVQKLSDEIDGIQKHVGEVEKIYRKRLVWAKLLSDIRAVIAKQDLSPQGQEYIWLTKMSLDSSGARAAAPARGQAASPVPTQFIKFEGYASAKQDHRALGIFTAFFQDLKTYAPPKTDVEKELAARKERVESDIQKLQERQQKAGRLSEEDQKTLNADLQLRALLADYQMGSIVTMPFNSFFSEDTQYWLFENTTWSTLSAPSGADKDSVATDMPTQAVKFQFRIGLKPEAPAVAKKAGK